MSLVILSHNIPEIDDDLIVLCITIVNSIFNPIIQVNMRRSTNEHLKLVRFENGEKIERNNITETQLNPLQVFLYTFCTVQVNSK